MVKVMISVTTWAPAYSRITGRKSLGPSADDVLGCPMILKMSTAVKRFKVYRTTGKMSMRAGIVDLG